VVNGFFGFLTLPRIEEGYQILTLSSMFHAFMCDIPYKDLNNKQQIQKKRDIDLKRNKFKMFECDIIMIPVCTGSHWLLIILNLKSKIIIYLDSFSKSKNIGSATEILDRILRAINQVHIKTYKIPFDLNDWKVYFPTDNPNQSNNNDCGVHICILAYLVLKSPKLYNYVQADCTSARRYIANCLKDAPDDFYKKTDVPNGDPFIITKEMHSEEYKSNVSFIFTPPEGASSTLEYLSTMLPNYYKATKRICAHKKGCLQPTEDMVLCGPCKDFYHPHCVQSEPDDHLQENYFCPSCKKKIKIKLR
jgi:hypothetical protein